MTEKHKAPGMIGRIASRRSELMSKIGSRDTGPEKSLRRELSMLGLKYRLYCKTLPGRPDIVFRKARVAVFCDGGFWHGKDWRKRKSNGQFKVRRAFWIHKIETNIARDRRNNRQLKKMGWIVLRFWDSEIKKDPVEIAMTVSKIVKKRTRWEPELKLSKDRDPPRFQKRRSPL